MSKEAIGENGAILGSGGYWRLVNHATFLGRSMRQPTETNYHESLRKIGERAGTAVDEIYQDLREHDKQLRAIPLDQRSALAKQVYALYDICRMAGTSCSHSSDCISMLDEQLFYLDESVQR